MAVVNSTNIIESPLTEEQQQEVVSTTMSSVTDPTLPTGTEQTYTTAEEAVGTQAIQEAMIAPDTATVTQTTAQAVAPATTTAVTAPVVQDAATMEAATAAQQVADAEAATKETLDARAQVVAEQGTLSEEAMAVAVERQLTAKETVAGQLDALFANTPAGEVPAWAKPAVSQVEAMLAARGIGKSSVAKEQLYNAIISSAMPIASADAQANREVFLTNLNNKNKEILFNAANIANMDMTNLNNRQMAAVENAKAFLQLDFVNLSNEQQSAVMSYQARQQALLSDTAAQNAARQFNASSENQTNQFFSNLATNVALQNAARADAMAQFNTTTKTDLRKFNAQLIDATKKFNAQNALVIEQANVQYRRQLNTEATAGINQANQINAQNAFNLSNQALSFLWQEMRDEAQWSFQADEAVLNRTHQETIANLEADAQKDAALYEALGVMGAQLFSAYIGQEGVFDTSTTDAATIATLSQALTEVASDLRDATV